MPTNSIHLHCIVLEADFSKPLQTKTIFKARHQLEKKSVLFFCNLGELNLQLELCIGKNLLIRYISWYGGYDLVYCNTGSKAIYCFLDLCTLCLPLPVSHWSGRVKTTPNEPLPQINTVFRGIKTVLQKKISLHSSVSMFSSTPTFNWLMLGFLDLKKSDICIPNLKRHSWNPLKPSQPPPL